MITPRELFKLALDSDSWFESKLELYKLRDLSHDLIKCYYLDFNKEVKKYKIEEADRRNKERLKDYYFASMLDENKEGNIPRSRSVLLKMLNKGLIFARWDPFEAIDPLEVYKNFTDYEEVHISILVDDIEEALKEMVEEAKNKEIPFDTNSDTSTGLSPDGEKLPKVLDTPECWEIWEQAKEKGVISDAFKWQKGLQLLACFAREMSLRFSLGKGGNSNGTKRINWRIFEELFNIEKGKLRSNYNDIQKTGIEPSEIYIINEIFGL